MRLQYLAFSLLLCAPHSAVAQPFTQCFTSVAAGGTADALTIPRLPCVPTTTFLILAPSANNTTANPTLQPAGGVAQIIVRFDGTSLQPGDLRAGARQQLVSNGSNWFLMNYAGGGGNMQGSSPSTMHEVTSWNNTVGSLLRQGPATMTDSKTAPITSSGAAFLTQSQPGLNDQWVTQRAPAVEYDGVRSVINHLAGSTATNVNAFGGYIANNNATGPTAVSSQSSALYFGIANSLAGGSSVWGFNAILGDAAGGTSRTLNGVEIDIVATNPTSASTGFLATGSSTVQSNAQAAFEATSTSVYDGRFPWKWGYLTTDGAADIGMQLGAVGITGNSRSSQPINFHGIDPTGTSLVYGIGVDPNNGFEVWASIYPAKFYVNGGGTFPAGVTAGSPAQIAFSSVRGSQVGLSVGEQQPAGTGVPSQPVYFKYFDGTGVEHAVSVYGGLETLYVLDTSGNANLQVSGTFVATGMPTSNPCTLLPAGALWNNGGVVNVC